ncbi:MAG: hypothetical protein ACJA19_000788 [Bacteroidia bacterium]|jgi:hypothetical protein|tara:strand:+ start:1653 stop:2243 length:591 start_codon:yes stop_codon:yes gene_type:complete
MQVYLLLQQIKFILNTDTPILFDQALNQCRDIFQKKTHDYGTAWRILRPISITDQIFIKAQRIRSIEEKQENKVGESIENEFIGIVNYCVIALIQMELDISEDMEINPDLVLKYYDTKAEMCKQLMVTKNHDYGEAWRDMRVSTYTDLILMKILRTKQIEDKGGKTLISEGIDANFSDMLNYAIFALIRINDFYKK